MKKLGIALIVTFLLTASAFAWHDETHIAIAKAAGYEKFYNAAGPDMIKVKADGIEFGNHYYNNSNSAIVTPAMVVEQTARYDRPGDAEGHLYGAIIAAVQNYVRDGKAGKYGEYHMAFAAHYIGDLSQPLHNTHYDAFNETHHKINDATIEAEALKNTFLIERNMYEIKIGPGDCERDLAAEIARIANLARELGNTLRKENRDMTKGEAYVQAGHSASLLKAEIQCVKRGH
jgi:hypothetical protein